MTITVGRAFLLGFLSALAVSALAAVVLLRDPDATEHPSFHDMRINQVHDLVALVDPDAPAVRSLAGRLGTPEAAYAHVRDRIRYVPMAAASSPGDVLRDGAASCLGKATLLCSLYRAMGISARSVRVITGNIALPGRIADHAWLDIEYKGSCLQQDPSGFLGRFEFAQFPRMEFTRAFVVEEDFCFNDEGFAVVSQLNRFRKELPATPDAAP